MKYYFIILWIVYSILLYSRDCPATEILLKGRYPIELINFETDSAQLSNEAKGILNIKVQYLSNHKSINLLIEGYCDERGSAAYNYKLGILRAKAVSDYFINFGIEESRITIISYGETRQLSLVQDERGWPENRVVIIKHQTDPAY